MGKPLSEFETNINKLATALIQMKALAILFLNCSDRNIACIKELVIYLDLFLFLTAASCCSAVFVSIAPFIRVIKTLFFLHCKSKLFYVNALTAG